MKTFYALAVLATLFLLPVSSQAQEGGNGRFNENSTLLGPHLGLAAYGSTPIFGANFETAVNKPGQLGPGILGVSGRLDYFSWNDGLYYKWTWIAAAAYLNYHFKVGETGEFDPFVGLGLGYQNVSYDYSGTGSSIASWGSGIYLAGNAGARYFLSRNLALRALIGFGVSYLVVGVDFGL